MTSLSATISAIMAFIKPYERPKDELQNEVLKQQQHQLMQMNLPIAAVNILLSSCIVLIIYDTAPVFWMWAWYIFILIFSSLLIFNWRSMRDKKLPDNLSGRYMRRVEYNILVYGFVWGAASFLSANADFYEQAVLMIIQVSTYAGLCGVIAGLPRITLRFGAPCLILVVVFNIQINPTLGLILLFLSLILMAALTSGGISVENQFANKALTVRQSQEAHQRLASALNSMTDAFCLREQDGKVVLANERYNQLCRDDREDYLDSLPANESTAIGDGRWIIRTSHNTPTDGKISIFTDVTALKDRELELIGARAEAEQADEAKSRFLSTMSHELRTPLNIILGFSKLMTQESRITLSNADVKSYSENIRSSGQHLLNLINDIIDYSKIGLDKYLLQCEPNAIGDVLEGAVDVARSLYGSDQIDRILCHVDPALGPVLVDPTAVQRIVLNLLNNALKYSGDSGRVILRAGLIGDGRPFVAVRDFGPGIPQDEIERVFEPFYQVGSGCGINSEGTGLGLTLSRHLAQLHGGNVQLKSHDGRGVTALVTFPIQTHMVASDLNIALIDDPQDAYDTSKSEDSSLNQATLPGSNRIYS